MRRVFLVYEENVPSPRTDYQEFLMCKPLFFRLLFVCTSKLAMESKRELFTGLKSVCVCFDEDSVLLLLVYYTMFTHDWTEKKERTNVAVNTGILKS